MSVRISFTGASKKLTAAEREVVRMAVTSFKGEPALFFSGAATGVDVWAAECAIRSFGDSKHVIYIPCWAAKPNAPPRRCQHDRQGINRLARLAAELGVHMKWEWCSPGYGSEAAGLLRRDDILAAVCTHLVAFPPHNQEVRRSGTWATVRRARERGRAVLIKPLDGSPGFKEKMVLQRQ